MYKDKDRQKEANKQASQRRRDKGKGMTPKGIVIPEHPVPVIPKRGKDIKAFADLPPDVQHTIDMISEDEAGNIDQVEKRKRTAVAISYQHTFPDRYYSTAIE